MEPIKDDDQFVKVGSISMKDFPKKTDGFNLRNMLGLNSEYEVGTDVYGSKKNIVMVITRIIYYKRVKQKE